MSWSREEMPSSILFNEEDTSVEFTPRGVNALLSSWTCDDDTLVEISLGRNLRWVYFARKATSSCLPREEKTPSNRSREVEIFVEFILRGNPPPSRSREDDIFFELMSWGKNLRRVYHARKVNPSSRSRSWHFRRMDIVSKLSSASLFRGGDNFVGLLREVDTSIE